MKWFFSYARADARDIEPGNADVDAFFRDLSNNVARLLPGADGFLDRRDVDLGEYWEPTILGRLGESSAMVCLLSPSYVASEFCSREWAYFASRTKGGAARIIPVMWVPLDAPPACVSALQFDNQRLPPTYLERGMQELTELRDSEHRDAYVKSRGTLARAVKEALAGGPLSPASPPPPRFKDLEDIFRAKAPHLTLSTTTLDLGVVNAGDSATLTIRNDGGGMLNWQYPPTAGNFRFDAPNGSTLRATITQFAADPEIADVEITSNGGKARLRVVAQRRGGMPESLRLDPSVLDVTDGPHTTWIRGIQASTIWAHDGSPAGVTATRQAPTSAAPNGGLNIKRSQPGAVDVKLRISTATQEAWLRVIARAPTSAAPPAPPKTDFGDLSGLVRGLLNNDPFAGTWQGLTTLTIQKTSPTSYSMVETNQFGMISFQGQTAFTQAELAMVAVPGNTVVWSGIALNGPVTVLTQFNGDTLSIMGVGTWQRVSR